MSHLGFASRPAPWELCAVISTAVLCRLPAIGDFPGVAGDEGNWALLAAAARGSWISLPPEAAFVTPLFAWILAPAAWLSPGWGALRAVPMLLVSAACIGVRVLGHDPLGARGARAAALLLALHPWSVMWSRNVSVPYALSLVSATLGPLALLHAQRRGGRASAVLAWQLVGVGVHFSPLGGVPLGLALVWAWRVRWRTALPAALGLAHLALVLPGVLALPAHARSGAATALLPGVFGAARMIVAQLSGVATLRHVAGASGAAEALGALVVLLTVAAAVRARDGAAVRASLGYLAATVIALPVMLVPARAWSMPTVDAERYGFAVLAPFVLLVGALASRGRSGAAIAACAVVGCALLPDAGLLRHARAATAVDLGLSVAGGGGRYRGWQRPHGGGALVDRAFDAARRDAAGAPAVVRYDDYAFHAIRLRTLGVPEARVRHALGDARPRPGERVYHLLWRPEVFAPAFAPWGLAEAQRQAWRGRRALRRVAVWRAMSGAPLCELLADDP
ncbi:MAG: hypothetical protein U0325_26550 [Polyangiales bacterium]